MPPKRRQPGAECMCYSDGHHHMGKCTNKVWGYNKGGYLYRVCDACRLSMTDSAAKEEVPSAREDKPTQPTPQPFGRPNTVDPVWTEQF